MLAAHTPLRPPPSLSQKRGSVHIVCGTAGAFRDAQMAPPSGGGAKPVNAPWAVVVDACEGCHRWGYTRWRANHSALEMEYVGNITSDSSSSSVLDRMVLVR